MIPTRPAEQPLDLGPSGIAIRTGLGVGPKANSSARRRCVQLARHDVLARPLARRGEKEPPLRDLIIDALRIIAPLSVALIVFAEALRIAPNQVVAYFKDRPVVMLRALLAALVLVPAAALGLILLLDPAPGVAV